MIYIFDIVKFVLSFLVVAIHVEPLFDFNPTIDFYFVNSICRVAVPTFFSIAGYLFCRKIDALKDNRKSYFFKYTKRIIFMYIFWSIIYLIPYMYQCPTFSHFLKFLPHLLINGVYTQLWYLQSLIVTVVLFYFMKEKFGFINTFYISIILYLFGLMLVPYYPLFQNFFDKVPIFNELISLISEKLSAKILGRNGLLFGLVFFSLGGILTKKNIKSNYIVNFGLIISILLMILETFIIKKIGGQYFGLLITLIPVSFFLMNFMINFDNNKLKNIDTNIFRSLSILIYLTHEWIHFLYSFFVKYIPILNNSLLEYFIICLLSVLISFTFYKLSNMEKFKVLKKVY